MCVAQGDRWAAAPMNGDVCAGLARSLGVEPTAVSPHRAG